MLWGPFPPSQTNPPLYASAPALATLQTVDVSAGVIPTKNVRKSFKNAAFPLTNSAFWHRFSVANFGVRGVCDGTRVGFGDSGTEEDRWKLPLVYSIPANMLKQL